jgi:hypothetical protein
MRRPPDGVIDIVRGTVVWEGGDGGRMQGTASGGGGSDDGDDDCDQKTDSCSGDRVLWMQIFWKMALDIKPSTYAKQKTSSKSTTPTLPERGTGMGFFMA